LHIVYCCSHECNEGLWRRDGGRSTYIDRLEF
jgi:hypothetical protein